MNSKQLAVLMDNYVNQLKGIYANCLGDTKPYEDMVKEYQEAFKDFADFIKMMESHSKMLKDSTFVVQKNMN